MTPSLPFLRLNTKSQNRIYLKENVHLLQSTKEAKEINNVLGDLKSLSVLCPPLDEFKLWQWKKILKDKVLQYANCYYLSDSMTECHQHSLMHFPLKKKRFNAHLVCAFTERCKKTTPFSSILPHKGGGNLWTGLLKEMTKKRRVILLSLALDLMDETKVFETVCAMMCTMTTIAWNQVFSVS